MSRDVSISVIRVRWVINGGSDDQDSSWCNVSSDWFGFDCVRKSEPVDVLHTQQYEIPGLVRQNIAEIDKNGERQECIFSLTLKNYNCPTLPK